MQAYISSVSNLISACSLGRSVWVCCVAPGINNTFNIVLITEIIPTESMTINMFDSCCLVKSWDLFIDVQKSVIERNSNLDLVYLHILLQRDVLMHFKFGNSPFISISKCLQTTSLPPTQDGNPIYTPSVSIQESPSWLGTWKMSLLITEINNGMSTKYEEHCEALRMTQGSSVRHLTWVVWELN